MRELTEVEARRDYLAMLEYVDAFCRKHDIQYFLYAGTLLGAVRHKGFIPWDDDIDICMPRPDFERFVRLSSEMNEHYEIQYINTVEHFALSYAKIRDKRTIRFPHDERVKMYPEQGLDIDVFPIDGFSENERADRIRTTIQTFIFRRILLNLIAGRNTVKWTKPKHIRHFIGKVLALFIKPEHVNRMNINISLRYPYESCNYVGASTALYRATFERVRKSCFEPAKKLVFEGREYYVPNDCDAVLTTLFGSDYMTPLPPEKRVSTHESSIFYKE